MAVYQTSCSYQSYSANGYHTACLVRLVQQDRQTYLSERCLIYDSHLVGKLWLHLLSQSQVAHRWLATTNQYTCMWCHIATANNIVFGFNYSIFSNSLIAQKLLSTNNSCLRTSPEVYKVTWWAPVHYEFPALCACRFLARSLHFPFCVILLFELARMVCSAFHSTICCQPRERVQGREWSS